MISLKLRLNDEMKNYTMSTIIDAKNGETMLISGISSLKAEKEGLNTLMFVTANIIDH